MENQVENPNLEQSNKPSQQINSLISGRSLHIYNTLTRKKEEFKSIVQGKVNMYSCGPTVYSDAHIGNLRSYIFPDILKRVLSKIGYTITHIINITDVGHLTDDASDGADKMELSAQKKGETVWDISRRYTENFMDDLKSLNILAPTKFTKATDYIDAQIEMVHGLEKKGYVYRIEDGIYFDTSKFKAYADFAKIDIGNLREGERVDFGEKRNKTDFALWKMSPKDGTKRQMEWDSPWGVGFPGWHIECSAMIWKELGPQIDIHTGGTDHIPVHHTNEIAQATCFHGSTPVNYWLHGEFLVLDKNKRIGKSEGNSITLNTLVEKGFDPIAYRFLVLTAHYKSFLTFSEESLSQAQISLQRLKKDIKKIYNSTEELKIEENNISLSQEAQNYVQLIMNGLLDDLNTPMALAALREMLSDAELTKNEKILITGFFDEIFGLELLNFSSLEKQNKPIPIDILKKAEERWAYKMNKNFAKADELRIEIEKLGYSISDYKDHYDICPIDLI
ncbi:MAG: cysteine--tRNA ligase [Candidatus Gracilibacteria bacterium]|nr:cysteine--tRNA ligase [Candidatus Gracilibacteria bacterium]MDD2908757.1 cysteine--tRNA ligase [Candidatus Gracilibacteria bacterium]